MAQINVFLATSGRNRVYQGEALQAFYRSLKDAGEDAALIEGSDYQPCEIAVVYGVPKQGKKAAQTRSTLYNEHKGTFVVLETPFLGRSPQIARGGLRAFLRRLRGKRNVVDRRYRHFRVGLNGAFYCDADFANENSPPDRWERLRQDLGLTLRPYRQNGSHILVVGQIPRDASLQGADIIAWMNRAAKEIKRHTDRSIVIRPHPGTKLEDFRRMAQDLVNDPQVQVELPPKGTIADALADCWCTVTYSSSAAVDSLLAGIPAIAMSRASIAWPVTDHDLAAVESPALHAREQWLYNLCYAQWSPEEIASGIVWSRLRDKALDRGKAIAVGSR